MSAHEVNQTWIRSVIQKKPTVVRWNWKKDK